MIFLGDLKHVKDSIFRIGHVHYSPFSSSGGLGKSKEELESIGVLVKSIPKPENIDGKYSLLCYDKNINEVMYIYEDISVTKEDEIEKMKYDILKQYDLNNLVMDMIDVLYIKSNNTVARINNNYNDSVINYLVHRCVSIFNSHGSIVAQEYLNLITSSNIDDKKCVIEILAKNHDVVLDL